ncbi:MAG TPA: diguanylate cyclase [Acidiferrobacteraceae bacterium]|nr:diguanylate cyclase [Acidiferrobacteraceae bacterium]
MSADMPRVLVVDDSAVIRQAISKMLRADFDLVLAGDGESGWERLSEDRRIGVLITDIEMPRLDGYAFICRVRAADDPRIRDIPIITITGAEDEETKTRAYACGATDFITKPLNAGQLQARVQAYLGFERGDQDLAESDVDELTRLYSRRAFVQQGTRLFASMDSPAALLHMEIDGFRKIYRAQGDEIANRVLIWAAHELLTLGATKALVARVGGAEFALWLPHTEQEEAAALGERIRHHFERMPFTEGAVSVPVTVSLGLAISTPRAGAFEALMQLADRRLRYAASKGGNQIAVTGLEDLLPSPEELVLAAPLVAPEVLSTEELDSLLVQAPEAEARAEPASASAPVLDWLSVDRALALLAQGQGERVTPYLEHLLADVLPLLRAYAEERGAAEWTLAEILQRCVRRVA